jgi:hypothetical protein
VQGKRKTEKMGVLTRLALRHDQLLENRTNNNMNMFTIDLPLQARENYMHVIFFVLKYLMYKVVSLK